MASPSRRRSRRKSRLRSQALSPHLRTRREIVRIFIAIVVLLLATGLASACGDKTPSEENEIRTSLNEFAAALNSENYDAAYAKFSNWCRHSIPQEKFTEEWESTMESGAAKLELTDVEIVSEAGDTYRVKTAFQLTKGGGTVTFGSESDPLVEWIVNEDGEWHIHDKVCELLGPRPGATPTPSPTP
jgi:hypothetical protein